MVGQDSVIGAAATRAVSANTGRVPPATIQKCSAPSSGDRCERSKIYRWHKRRLFMTSEQIIDEAMRLTTEGDYANALQFWETLSGMAFLDVESKCLYLLNERRCRTALGQHEIAQQLLDRVENIDISGRFCLEVEHARIDELYNQHKFVEANKRSEQFARENSIKLADPEFALIAYEQKLGLASGLIHANEFDAGLKLLTELLPVAAQQDKERVHYYRGLAYRHLKREDAAIDEFKQIVASADKDLWVATAHYQLGLIYESKGMLAWAKHHLQNAELLKDLITFPVSYIYMALSNVCFRLHEIEEGWRYRKLAESEGV
jgi:tetratricopeptide (TPR) repeat protein